ncbi:hypothetical protein [Flavihumibacter fluvii]|uniref:hypothetical protein n=1 Tax=Flavihumibacter fluvii TaxID=2838157 RepID=UPI001BDEE474|nr:hypothetical protein [Flavihumibacter fluvii]ULQ51156.1 hypothetical protein KJS93_13790 [Flavihumibacter fluvii]
MMKRLFLALALLWLSLFGLAQKTVPVNSNYLIARGISPKILDAALSATLQEGAYTQNTYATRARNG